jgi:hypothetical protein
MTTISQRQRAPLPEHCVSVSLSAARSATSPMSVKASEHRSLAKDRLNLDVFVAILPAISVNSALIAE